MGHVVLYVPGLGDKKRWLIWLQQQTFQLWRLRGMRVEIVRMKWAEAVPLKPRFDALLSRIDELHASGSRVSLVGTSAGASAVVSAYALKPKQVNGVVTICGKLKGDLPDTIKELNPCFAESFAMLQKYLGKLSASDKRRIMALYPLRDSVVPPEEATIDGAQNVQVSCVGHNLTCAYILLCKPRLIARFINSL